MMVEEALKKLKPSISPGPDGIPACILKHCKAVLIAPLKAIFNLSLRCQQFPKAWKMSYMRPIFKKGSRTEVSNYRGITSLPAGSKCFEIIMNDVLLQACKTYISQNQHGFFPQRSVISNLCEYTSFCIKEMDKGGQVDSIYTDIKAAFDTVDHSILLAKLNRLGASSRICSWLYSYLTDRQLLVKIGKAISAPFTPHCGVPQGSNLGPLLFVLFFNDVSHVLSNCYLLFYADDLKIYLIVRSINDCRQLQEQLDLFVSWCTLNHLSISVSKCCIISFRRMKSPVLYNYAINGTILNRVDNVKDLGVLLDHQLTFKMHYSETVDKANRQLGFIFKIASEFDDPLCLKSLYCSLVRSILEFASVIWSPYDAVWIARIESIQRRFVRCALRSLPWSDPLRLPPYEHRCALLGIETLEERRKMNQAVFGAKVLRSEIDSPALLRQLNIYAPQRVLRSRQLLYQPPRRTMYGSNNPIDTISRRFQDNYNLFDFNISTNTFKNRLRNRQV